MRKQISLIALSICILSASVPCRANNKGTNDGFWIDLGLKGGFGTTWLFNPNTLGGSVMSNNFSLGWTYGGKLGLNFTNVFELTGEFLLTTFNQNYSINIPAGGGVAQASWTKKVQGNLMDIPVLIRLNLGGTYVEFGPQFSLVSGFAESNSGSYSASFNATPAFNSSEVEGVVGFGRWIRSGADNFNFALGLRVMYGFADYISAAGASGSGYPINADPGLQSALAKTPVSYEETHPFSAMLVLEVNYDLAYIMLKHVCHRTAGR